MISYLWLPCKTIHIAWGWPSYNALRQGFFSKRRRIYTKINQLYRGITKLRSLALKDTKTALDQKYVKNMVFVNQPRLYHRS